MGLILFLLLLLVFIACDLVFWRWADRRVRRIGGARVWRALVAAFAAVQVLYIVVLFIAPLGVKPSAVLEPLPLAAHCVVYVWHILVLPLTMLALLSAKAARRLKRRAAAGAEGDADATERAGAVPGVAAAESADPVPRPTRRQVLAAAAAALPPLAAGGIAWTAVEELGSFRIRRVEVRVPSLPADLDGLTIAHVTDLHIGKFLPAGMAERVADATNALAADLVTFTGDLIDVGDVDKLPKGIEFIRRLDPRHGLVMIEGNHDVQNDPGAFDYEARTAGLPLLLDETATFRVPGRSTPVQFLGLTWGEWKVGRDAGHIGREADRMFRVHSDEATEASLRHVLSFREPDAFPILLAHHPHAFDPAAAAGLPLVLAGHTHGGQLMLTKNIGAGPLRFRYWTGLYEKPGSRLFVNNGVGNWFPLRVNAPPEIVHLTLRQA